VVIFSLQLEVKRNLNLIKATQGVENVVLTQRDGNPIQYSGIWLSQNEIFNVSAATSAIYNCGLQLHHQNLKYILIEGNKAKILISPLKQYGSDTLNRIIDAQNLQGNDDEFFIAISTQPSINLGGIFLKIRKALTDVKKALILSGESFKPPLRQYSEEEIKELMDFSEHKEESGDEFQRNEIFNSQSLNFSLKTYYSLESILEEFNNNTLDLLNSFVSIKGGYVLTSQESSNDQYKVDIDSLSCLTYSLFATANKCSWILKKMSVKSILLDCVDYCQFIHQVGDGIFSSQILKGRQKLGLLRLIIPRFCLKIENVLKDSYKEQKEKDHEILDITELISEITI